MIGQCSRKINPAILVLSILLAIAVAVLTFLVLRQNNNEAKKDEINQTEISEIYQEILENNNEEESLKEAQSYIDSAINTKAKNEFKILYASILYKNAKIKEAIQYMSEVNESELTEEQKQTYYQLFQALYYLDNNEAKAKEYESKIVIDDLDTASQREYKEGFEE